MSPNPRGRIRHSDDDPDRRLRARLDLLIALMIVQLVFSAGLWIDRNSSSESEESVSGIVEESSARFEEKTQAVKPKEKPPVSEQSGKKPKTAGESTPIDEELIDHPIRLQVLNGCGVSGIAGRAGTWLTRNGYDVREVENADREDYSNSIIMDRVGNQVAATILARDLNIDKTRIRRQSAGPDPMFELTLILGKDYKQLPFAR